MAIYLQRAVGPPFFELDELRSMSIVRELRQLPREGLVHALDGMALYRSRAALEIQLTNVAERMRLKPRLHDPLTDQPGCDTSRRSCASARWPSRQ